jgi:hypothetical protein
MDRKAALWALISFIAGAGLQISGYQNPYLATALFLIAGLLLMYALRDRDFISGAFAYLPVGRISLAVAARIAYERLRGTLWGKAAERLSLPAGSPEGILEYMATAISKEAVIYGCRPPSTKLEPIDEKEFQHGNITDGGKALNYFGEKSYRYTDLSIGRRELRKAIKRMKNARV